MSHATVAATCPHAHKSVPRLETPKEITLLDCCSDPPPLELSLSSVRAGKCWVDSETLSHVGKENTLCKVVTSTLEALVQGDKADTEAALLNIGCGLSSVSVTRGSASGEQLLPLPSCSAQHSPSVCPRPRLAGRSRMGQWNAGSPAPKGCSPED